MPHQTKFGVNCNWLLWCAWHPIHMCTNGAPPSSHIYAPTSSCCIDWPRLKVNTIGHWPSSTSLSPYNYQQWKKFPQFLSSSFFNGVLEQLRLLVIFLLLQNQSHIGGGGLGHGTGDGFAKQRDKIFIKYTK